LINYFCPFFTGVLAVCWIPYVVFTVWHIARKDIMVEYCLEFVVNCLKYMSILLNPLVIILLNRDYRYFFKRFLSRLGCSHRKVHVETNNRTLVQHFRNSFLSGQSATNKIDTINSSDRISWNNSMNS